VASIALSGAVLATACYRYVPTPVASIPPNEEVHVRLTPMGGARLSEILGSQPDELEGYVAPRGDSLSVSVVVARAYRGVTFDSSRQAFVLAPSEVVDVRRRQFSRKRTTLAVVGTAVGFAALIGTIVAIADPNPSPEEPLPPPPPPNIRIPFPAFRLSFR
jgi:hypothetical protein